MRSMAIAITLLLAGCATEAPESQATDTDGDGYLDAVEQKVGSDPHDAASLPPAVHEDVTFTGSATVVGTGVPSVQCPADAVNVAELPWTIDAPSGNVSGVHVADLVFTAQGAASVVDVDLFVFGPDGRQLGSATGSTATEEVAVAGHQPVGTYTIQARGCAGAGDVAIEATGQLGWIPSNEDLLHAQGIQHEH